MAKLGADFKKMLQNKQSSSIHKDPLNGWEGGSSMKKLAVLHPFAALLILSVALMLFSGPAQAYVYDDFTSSGISGSLWTDIGPNSGLFSQPGDSYLYFTSSNYGEVDKLKSSNPVSGPFFVSNSYSNFQAVAPYHGQWLASNVELQLSDGTNTVFVVEGENSNGKFFAATSVINGTKSNVAIIGISGITSGWLGMGYNGISGAGGEATFWYNSGAGWTELASCAPDFSQAPNFFIVGYNYGSSLSFQVDQVQLTSTPLPPSVLLLGSGLLGLVGWRRFRKS